MLDADLKDTKDSIECEGREQQGLTHILDSAQRHERETRSAQSSRDRAPCRRLLPERQHRLSRTLSHEKNSR